MVTAAVIAVVGAAVLAIFVGPANLPARGVLLALIDGLPGVDVEHGLTVAQQAVLWQIRLPRVVLGALVGATLAIAGAAYQGCSATRWPIPTCWGCPAVRASALPQ